MPTPLDPYLETIRRLCAQYQVKKLYVFGSILTDEFGPESDVDLLAEFKPQELLKYGDNYFDFKFALEDLLHRPVDLLVEKALRNPYLIQQLQASRIEIYCG